jgi:sugar phosphate isomerase/epimerase
MKLGVFNPLFQGLSFEDMLDRVVAEGLEAVEIGTGNYPGNAHCDPAGLLQDDEKRRAFVKAIADRNLMISALSCQGNPLHPQRDVARRSHETFERTVELASKIGVDCVVVFSGCPGDSDSARYPNWVVSPWPPDYQELIDWQWKEKVIPYWQEAARFARRHGVRKIAIEMHPGFVVYNPRTLLKLREAVGEEIGATFDPSHLFWQGVDQVAAIKALGRAGALFHFHAKDTALDPQNTAVNGVLDPLPLGDLPNRSWLFRTVGYGHGESVWRDIISALRLVGYDGVLSIEHEDALASVDEGFRKAVAFLKQCMLAEPAAEAWWA